MKFLYFVCSFLVYGIALCIDIVDVPGSANHAVNEVGTAQQVMSISEWSRASMRDVTLEVFRNDPQVGLIANSIDAARLDSLRRRLRYIADPRPHTAVARVVYKADDGTFVSNSINQVFFSSVQHGQQAHGALRYAPAVQPVLSPLSLGIAPYTGSPCKYAHSERAVGVYLMDHLDGIVVNKEASFALIQIKTSLPPCDDCVAFWSGLTVLSNRNFACSCQHALHAPCVCPAINWLEELRKLSGIEHLEVSISSGVRFAEDLLPLPTDLEFLRRVADLFD